MGKHCTPSQGMRIRNVLALLLAPLVAATVAATTPATAAPFIVTDADFDGGVYDFHFYNKQTQRTVINGVDGGTADPTLTNIGWERTSDPGGQVVYWAAGQFGSFPARTSGSLTMGWDFSAVTGKIAKVELNPRHFLFQFDPWNSHAVGDEIAGFLSTPTSFGSGPYQELYRYTGQSGNTTTVGAGTLMDYAPEIGAAWLDNPDLIEFKFTYEQTPNPTIPAAHLQVFRDIAGTGDAGFVFRVTLRDESNGDRDAIPAPATLPCVAFGLVALGCLRHRRR